jgi:hypothetical protein
VAESSKARACSHPIYWIASSNPVGSMDVSVLSTVCCKIEVSATGPSLIQRNFADCDV